MFRLSSTFHGISDLIEPF